MVSTIATILRQGEPTVFAFEAACRHGLRIRLIFEGWRWADADSTAAEIVATALRRIGAQRPTWLQGQREYTISTDQCSWCRGDLTESDILRGRRFCSVECARARIHYKGRDQRISPSGDVMGNAAYYILKLAAAPERPCQHCGRPYKSADRAARFCSQKCFAEASRTLADRTCANPVCGKVFRPDKESSRFCSHACFIEGRSLVLAPRSCAQCGGAFQPKNESAMYCSPVCLSRSKDARKSEKLRAARVPISCEHCRAVFVPARADKRFCTVRCQKAAARARYAPKASAFTCEAAE